MCIWSRRYSTLAVILILISLTVGPPTRASAGSDVDLATLQAGNVESDRAGQAHPKISSELRAATGLFATTAASPASAPRAGFLRQGNLIAVTIRTSDAAATASALDALSRRPANFSPHTIEAYLSGEDVTSLEAEPSVIFMQAIVPPQSKDVVGQGRAAHNAANWINGGLTGAGVRVGVIDYWFRNIQSVIGTELPANLTARCYSGVGAFSANINNCTDGGDHGTAVAESVLDLAPGVELFIADPSSPLDFQASVAWMISQGVSVIVFSQAFPWDGPGDGTSPFAESPLRTVDAAVNGGALFVIAAGNERAATWLGPWRDTNADTFHEFSAAPLGEANGVNLIQGEVLQVQARWQDAWPGAASDLLLEVRDPTTGAIAAGNNPQGGASNHVPREFVSFTAPRTGMFQVRLRRTSGPIPAWVQVQAFSSQALQFSTNSGGMCNPAESANPGALAVGAASWQTTSTIEDFSSLGPTPDGRIKPDIVGADRGATAVRSEFAGTSQAAPYVAGLAALVKDAFPGYSAAQVAAHLKTSAQPRGPVPNNTWGYGFAYLVPSEPLNLVSSVIGNNVSLTWQPPIAGVASGYVIEAGSAPGLTNLAVLPVGNALSFATAAANGTYYVRVRAQSGTGVGVASNERTVQVGSSALPGAPTNLQVALNGTNVSFSWTPASAGGSPSGYRLEASLTPGGAVIATLSSVTNTLFVPGVPPGRYYARVRATNAAGAGSPSNEVTVIVGGAATPSAPLLSGRVAGSSVSLTWNHPGAASYAIHAGTASGLSNVGIFPVGSVLGATASGVPPGVYFVRVIASGAGGAAASNEVVLSVGS